MEFAWNLCRANLRIRKGRISCTFIKSGTFFETGGVRTHRISITMKKSILAALLVFLIGCAKKEEAPAPFALTPSETVLKVCDALTRNDSAAYLNLVSSSRRRAYAANPMLLRVTLAFWAAHRPSIQIVSESQQGTTATVTYRLRFAAGRLIDTTESTQLSLENGAWKYTR